MRRFWINYDTNTMKVTREFWEKMQDITSEEYQMVKNLRKDFPNMQVIKHTHRSPSRCQNSNGEVFYCNQFKHLTYEGMERFISSLREGESYLKEYEYLRDYAAQIQTNGYAMVRRWFIDQFPEFRTNPLFYVDNIVEVLYAENYIQPNDAA